MFTDVYPKVAKVATFFSCEKCHYTTSKKADYVKHLATRKHLNVYQCLPKKSQKSHTIHACNCGKEYSCKQSLYVHKKKCPEIMVTKNNDEINEKELIMLLVKQNSELLEVIKNGTHNTMINNHSNNKTFNLQFFLNETCKDAMNIMDFVDSIKLQLSDLENFGEIGYVNGISNIIVKNLKELDITERPVHCTDKKRDILYIKDENKWEKEDSENKKMRRVIKKVANKNIRLLQKFKEEHPDCGKSDSKYSDQYNKLIIEAMGGSGDNDTEKEDKIIKKIAKEVIIDK